MSATNRCYNCGHSLEHGGHYVPPSFGDEGFYACNAFCDECRGAAQDAGHPFKAPPTTAADGSICVTCGQQHVGMGASRPTGDPDS